MSNEFRLIVPFTDQGPQDYDRLVAVAAQQASNEWNARTILGIRAVAIVQG